MISSVLGITSAFLKANIMNYIPIIVLLLAT